MDWSTIHSVDGSSGLQDLQKHQQFFQDELGTLQGTEAIIHVPPHTQPRFFKARPIPYAKSDGSLRICGDYSVTVNAESKLDSYPLPRVDDLFTAMSGGVVFSKLDLKHDYQQYIYLKNLRNLLP